MNKQFFRMLMLLLMTMCFATSSVAAETTIEQPVYQTGKAALTFSTSPLKTMTEIPFSIKITDASGTQISDAKLIISMDMPAMPMPANNPVATWVNDAYRGKAIFTMAGAWQVKVTIQRSGNDPEQATFDIEQVMMK